MKSLVRGFLWETISFRILRSANVWFCFQLGFMENVTLYKLHIVLSGEAGCNHYLIKFEVFDTGWLANLIDLPCFRIWRNQKTPWDITIRELQHQAFLLSRRPTGTKLSADVAYLNTSCSRGDRHKGASYKLLFVTVLVYQNFFLSKEWLQAPNKSSINLCKLIVYLQLL